ncbi:MAG TPA: hypothetical protein VNI02_02205 [Blastocatellia bacterium]|jgi:hypothetical protein|nr:hypothetical protein [Blastocatellia bacterium]
MDAYKLLASARSYIRKLDGFYAQAAATHNATLEQFQVLLAVKSLGAGKVAARLIAEHLVRDRATTIQLCWRMQELGLLELTYETNSAKPQLLVSLSPQGENVLSSITQEGLMKRYSYLKSLSPERCKVLAEAVRFSWLNGLEQGGAESDKRVRRDHHS